MLWLAPRYVCVWQRSGVVEGCVQQPERGHWEPRQSPAEKQQGNRDLSAAAKGNWILSLKMDSPLEPPEGKAAQQHLDFSLVRLEQRNQLSHWLSDPQSIETINLLFYIIKFVVVFYGSNRKLIHFTQVIFSSGSLKLPLTCLGRRGNMGRGGEQTFQLPKKIASAEILAFLFNS